MAVSFPIPVLAPVMSTVFPSKVTVEWHTPPAAYFLFHTHTHTHIQRHADEQQLHFHFPRTGAGYFHSMKDWTHGRPELIIYLEVRSESYEERGEAPRSQSLPPLNARMFNPIPRRASWLARAADRRLPLHLFAKLPQLHQCLIDFDVDGNPCVSYRIINYYHNIFLGVVQLWFVS